MIDAQQVDKTGWNDNTYIDGLGNDVEIEIFNPLQPTTYIVIRKREEPREYVIKFSSLIDKETFGTLDGREHKVVIVNLETNGIDVEGWFQQNEIDDGSIYRGDWGTLTIQPGQVMTIRYFWVQLDVRYCIVDYVIT